MKFSEAKRIINRLDILPGFYISFTHYDGQQTFTDRFPEKDEPLIPTKEEARELARSFARPTKGTCLDIMVLDTEHEIVPDENDMNFIPNL